MKPKARNPIRDHDAESALFFRRALVAFGGVVTLIFLLLLNMYNLQIDDHQAYITRADGNRIKIIPIAPNRGLIYDRNGEILAENRPVYALEIIPEDIQYDNIDTLIAELQKLITISDSEIAQFHRERKKNPKFNSIRLKNQLTEQEVAIFSSKQYKFKGVDIKGYLKRYYPYGDILAHTLGYVSRINDRDQRRLKEEGLWNNYSATPDIGKIGIEKFYEKQLHGTAGYKEVEVNSEGRVIRILKEVAPISGADLTLTLDIKLQSYIYNLLQNRRSAVVVLDPKDSGVLAMISTPSYDPNAFVNGISQKNYDLLNTDSDHPMLNRATTGSYPPASTVKPFIAIAALDEKVITPNTTRDDPGYWKLPNSNARAFRDWQPWGHGKVDILNSIEESVDTFFYQVAYDLGIDRLSTWMKQFGFGEPTGIDIGEEISANMPTRDWKRGKYRQSWYKGDTIPVGIGQGYWTATPIQIAKATTMLINKGTITPPHLLKSYTSGESQALTDQKTIVPKQQSVTYINGVEDKYWNIALEGMHLVNHGRKGTARKSFTNTPYESAGKSGTAQVFGLKEDEKYKGHELPEKLRDHALFTGFAPYESPEIVVSMVIENAGGGSSNGAPITRKIFDYVLLPKSESELANNKSTTTK